jgi:hypothetical protein
MSALDVSGPVGAVIHSLPASNAVLPPLPTTLGVRPDGLEEVRGC